MSQNINNLSIAEELLEDGLEELEVPIDNIISFKQLLENMKCKYHGESTTKDEKYQLLTLLPSNWSFEDVKKHFNITLYMFRLARKLQAKMGPMSKPSSVKKGKHFL